MATKTKKSIDQTNKSLVYYGPHPCQRCNKNSKNPARIVKAGNGAPDHLEFEYPEKAAEKLKINGFPYPNTHTDLPWRIHKCSALSKLKK